MSAKEKALKRLLTIPADYRWSEMETILKGFGFERYDGAGSRVKFYRAKDHQVIILHTPHPKNIMQEYMIRQVIDKLRESGDLDG